MSALTFWFYFILIGSGCGFVSVIVLIIQAVQNRPRKPNITEEECLGMIFTKALCGKCGRVVKNGPETEKSFCPHCGTRIKWRKSK